MISINKELCNRCGKCQRVCPAFIPVVEQDKAPYVRHPEVCIGCGHCVDVCATGAFLNDQFSPESIHTINRELLPSPESLMELIRSRRSNRTITTKPIPQSSLDMIMEAARYAPTAQNSRQVQLHLITDDEALHRVEAATIGYFMRLAKVLLSPPIKWIARLFLGKLYDEVPALYAMNEQFKKGKRPTICNSTVLLVISAPKGYDFGMQDCNLAYQNASLMAESLGVSQVYMGFVQVGMFMMGVKKASRILGIPENHKAFAIMGLGMPAFKYQKYTNR